MATMECSTPPDTLAPPLRPLTYTILFSAYCGFLFFYGLNAGELYRTESLRAIIAEEFLRSGNWIVPTLYGDPWLTKPPGMYAAIALVSWPFGGVTTWSARLPSALAATATVVLFFLYFRRQLGPAGGWLAGLLLPMSMMWLDKATAAEIDMLQVFWVTAAILCFLQALEREELGQAGSGAWWLAALLSVAGGVLTKWTAPVFFYGTVIPLLWLRGRLRLLWSPRHLLAAVLGAGVCLAWVAAVVWLESWDALYATVSREALMRLSPSHHHRPYPWFEALFHPLKVFAAALPISVFALIALRKGFSRNLSERQRRLLQAMHCWIWPSLLFWSLTPQHSVRNSFPLYPGIVGLAVIVWMTWLSRQSGVFRLMFIAGVLFWLAAKLTYVHTVIPIRNGNRLPRERAEQIAAIVPAGQILYLSMLKDEGIMFYYGRTVRRIWDPARLPYSPEPLYCILQEAEWRRWDQDRPAEALLHLQDEQGDPIVLIRATARLKGDE